MEFPHSFYEDEVRCDFLIPSMVKRTWAAQIEILADLDEACQRCGLEYFAEWGTLLGTVRHGGFIPWDDDVDICMKRKDYDRLVKNVHEYLPDDYSIVNFRSSRDFKQMLSRLVSSDHYRFDPEYMHKFSGLPIAMGIDIFPLDYMTDDEAYEQDRRERIDLVYDVVNEIAYFDTPVTALSDSLARIEKRLGIKIDRSGDVLTRLREELEKMFGEVDEKDAAYLTLYPLWLNGQKYRFPKAYYGHGVRMKFENVTIPVPVCYEAILRHKYGDSFMLPIRSGGAHDYPYYEKHLKVLREHFGFEWPAYRFNRADLTEGGGKAPDSGTCLFITYTHKAFANMKSLARKYMDDGFTVTVLPVTKYDIAPDMTGIAASDENVPDGFYAQGLDGINITRDSSVLDTHPDIIVTDYPYDEYNLITTVDRAFYSRRLKKCCDRLVYVPAFEALSVSEKDERAKKLMPQYVCTPLAALCDEIVVHSDEMKERYTECLTGFSQGLYGDIWSGKIKVLKNPEEKKQKSDLSGRIRILFYVGIGMFAQSGEKALAKIQRVLGIFEENRDRTEVIFKLQDGLSENLKLLYPHLYEGFVKLENSAYTGDINTDGIDAYYGESSPYVSEFYNSKKPVMLPDCECR